MKLTRTKLKQIIREKMELLNEGDVKKKINRRGDVDGLIVTHNGKEYEIVYSSDFGQSTSVQPYGIVMPGDDVVSFLGKDKRAKRIWKQLKPKVDKFLKVNEGMKKLKEMTDPAFIPYVGNIDTWKLKSMYIKNGTADGILTNAEKKFMKKPDVVVITANRFNTIWTDGKQEFQINIKTNKLVKPLRKARKEIQNHFKNLKYRWQGDKLIFEAKWSDFKHTKGIVHIPLGIKTELDNSYRRRIGIDISIEFNKNKSWAEELTERVDFDIFIVGGSLVLRILPEGKRTIRKRIKKDKDYLRKMIDEIKGIIKKNKYILNPIQESKFNHNAAEAFGAYMRGEISVEEVTKIAKQAGKQVATKAELNGFLKNKFMQELMADTYNTPQNQLVRRVKALLKVTESLNEGMDKQQAGELLRQLGGNKFIAMTGAKGFTVGPKGAGFRIGRNPKGINYVRIDLDGRDLYTMEFIQLRGTNIKVKSKEEGVYVDQLRKVFTTHTGLLTSLTEANEGDRFVHKYSPEIEIELIEPTNRGWKVKQKTGRKSKTAYFDKQDIMGAKAIFKPIKESILRKIIREEIKRLGERKESGLMVYPSTPRDKAKIQNWLDSSDYYGEWEREGYFLFPEKRSSYDSLEDELGREFLKHKINVRFEGV